MNYLKRLTQQEVDQLDKYGTFNMEYINIMNNVLCDMIGDNTEFDCHKGNYLKQMIDEIKDASADKVYVIKVHPNFGVALDNGEENPDLAVVFKPHVLIDFNKYALRGKDFSGGFDTNVSGVYLDLSYQNLENVKFNTAKLQNVNFFKAYCVGTDFTGATLPTAINTKETFKAFVGAWDATTTIWTDGQPIGNGS